MDRFFFHLASKDDTIFDTNGREFSDLAAAHRHAMQLIHKLVVLDDMDWRGWSINVADANNQSALSVLFPQTSYFQWGNKARQLHHDTTG
jgi:Domain of unknown function (DUF6894)